MLNTTAIAEIKTTSNALANRSIKGPQITSERTGADTINVYANGVLITILLRDEVLGWTVRYPSQTRFNEDPAALVDEIEDLAAGNAQFEFVKEFPAYPPLTFVLTDVARENATGDSPFRITWDGLHVATAVLDGGRWMVLDAAGAPITDAEFYHLGGVADRVNALVPFLVA